MPEKILVMDEQDGICLYLSDILTPEGYTVLTADNMPDGLRLFQVQAPDLVIADVRMPIGPLLDLLGKTKDSSLEVDLIALAAEDDESAAMDWLGKGVYDYLLKPLGERGALMPVVRRALQKRRLVVQNGRLSKELQLCTVKDPLTGLYNHRLMHKCLVDEIMRSTRYDHQFLLILADIDRLNTLNDDFGRNFGDFVLMRMARLLEDNLRLTDSTFRYEGGKFLMLLPETRKNQAVRVAERILESIRYHDFSYEGCRSRVTISMGAAEFPAEARDIPSLIGLADRRLKVAKDTGRDCFQFDTQEDLVSDFFLKFDEFE